MHEISEKDSSPSAFVILPWQMQERVAGGTVAVPAMDGNTATPRKPAQH
jgi:hypothetical protein